MLSSSEVGMRHIVVSKGGDRMELHAPISSAALYAAVAGWWPKRGLMDRLALDRFCEAASGVDECSYFGELCAYLGVEVSWIHVAEDRCLF